MLVKRKRGAPFYHFATAVFTIIVPN